MKIVIGFFLICFPLLLLAGGIALALGLPSDSPDDDDDEE